MPAGRPTKYKEEYCQELIDYFNIDHVRGINKETKDGRIVEVIVGNSLPLLTGFANKIGVVRSTLYLWANETNEDGTLKNPEFSNAYARAKEMQEDMLVSNALNGMYDTKFAVFAAKNMIGWRDKQEIDHSSKDGTMTPTRPADLTAALLDTTDHTG